VLVNPYLRDNKDLLAPIPGTRLLRETLGLLGTVLRDPINPLRAWTIQGLYAPIRGRALGGLRAKVVDTKGFITFVNQRDLEVILELASPGNYCSWLDKEYVHFDDEEWFGFCCDEDDLEDDLYDRELSLRAQMPEGSMLPTGLDIVRRVYLKVDEDVEEVWQLIRDTNIDGIGPDTRFASVTNRWALIERTDPMQRKTFWFRV
jgi:hypothetical protein